MLSLEVVDTLPRLQNFRAEWEHFLRRVPADTPFQTPAWLLTWWSHFGSGTLHILVFRDATRTVGVIPSFLHEWNEHRQLTLIGTGLSDYLDPVFDRDYSPAIVECLQSHLGISTDWDVCDWQDLSSDTPLVMFGELQEDTACMLIRFPPTFDAFLAQRPRPLRYGLRHDLRKAQALGSVRFDVSTEAEPALLTALIELHAARWRSAGQEGVIAAQHAETFLRASASAMAKENILLIFTLRLDERIVAIILAMRNQNRVFAYLSGFDPAYEELGFGRQVLRDALRYVHDQGYRSWDFLRGEEAYKSLWGAERIPKRRLLLKRNAAELSQASANLPLRAATAAHQLQNPQAEE